MSGRLNSPLSRRAPIRGRSETSAAQKTRRPAVLVFAKHRRAHDHDPAFDASSNLLAAPSADDRQASKVARLYVGVSAIGAYGVDQNALSRRCLANAQAGAEGGEAQGDPAISETHNWRGASHPSIRFELQVENPDP